MPNFATLAMHDGTPVSLTFVSPTLLKDILRRAVVRELEMHVGRSLDVGWDRAGFDICKSQLRSKKYSALEK
eukprot:1868641-Pyramimonas_sp.AAC.1